jgi:hypothetical protein
LNLFAQFQVGNVSLFLNEVLDSHFHFAMLPFELSNAFPKILAIDHYRYFLFAVRLNDLIQRFDHFSIDQQTIKEIVNAWSRIYFHLALLKQILNLDIVKDVQAKILQTI